MALVAVVAASPDDAFSVHYYLGATTIMEGGYGAIPFAIANSDGLYYCGFAAAPWVTRLLEAAITLPEMVTWSHQIIGLLLGYSPTSIQEYESMSAGTPTATAPKASTAPGADTTDS